MDEEPVARALLVASVTCLTVGLVTLALGIAFLIVDIDNHQVLWIWGVAVGSGLAAILVGAQLSSLTCNGRSSRPVSLACLIIYTVSTVVGVGLQVALMVLSAFHVRKDGSRREIFIFFLASSTIQMAAQVIAPILLLICNTKVVIPNFRKKSSRKEKDSSDNYGFIGDGEMWCSSRPPKSTNLSRWPGIEHLEKVTAASSTSSIGSIHPGHYIAGDHHHKFIGPSSDDTNSQPSTPSSVIETNHQNGMKPQNGSVVYAEIHTSKMASTSGSSNKIPIRPPRQRDAFNLIENSKLPRPSRRPEKTVTVSTISRSYSPLGSPSHKRIYLYDPVEMDISTPSTKRVNWQQNGSVVGYEDVWMPRKGIFGHNLHGINVNGLHSLRPSTSLPPRIAAPSSLKRRPKEPPPAVPNGRHRGSSLPMTNGDLSQRFIIGEWEDLNSPLDGVKLQATSTPKHPRKVTFLESDT